MKIKQIKSKYGCESKTMKINHIIPKAQLKTTIDKCSEFALFLLFSVDSMNKTH